MSLTDNNWHLLNQIIYDIYSSDDIRCMRKKFMENIEMLIPYEKANFFMADIDDDERLITDPISIGFEESDYDDYYDSFYKYDYNNWIFSTAQNDVFILDELLTPHELRDSLYAKEWLLPKKLEHVLLLSLSFNDVFVGVVSLFRTTGNKNFSLHYKKIFELLKNHLSLYLYKTAFQNKIHMSKTSGQIAEKYGLSQRETEVFTMLISGNSSEEICQSLCVSDSTFRKHCSNIYRKLGVSKQNELNKFLL